MECRRIRRVRLHHGAAIVEVVVALPILLAVILGSIQFGLLYQAKATLNHASLQAARAGAVENADPEAIRRGLARGLAPLYSPQSSLGDVGRAAARVHADLLTDARIRILNPTKEAFADFGETVDGVREIPNDRLHARSTTVGAQSGVNIQDANILRVQVTYGYELKVPLVNWFITRALLALGGDRSMDAFEQQLLRRTLLPIVATATVRMQSPARLNELVVARADLPEVGRFDASTRPPDEEDANESAGEEDAGDTGDSDDRGSHLGEGFLGFGGGPAGGSGGGPMPPPDGAGGSGGAPGDGANIGNPQHCPGGGDASPFLPPDEPPGDFSPVIDLPNLAVGAQIHVATGNKYEFESDIAPAPGPLGVEFARHYNSASASSTGVLGSGWRHSYEVQLHGALQSEDRSNPPRALYVTQADGRELKFVRSARNPQRYEARRASDGELTARKEGYRWRRADGQEFVFARDGRLLRIRQRRHALTLHYDARQRIAKVVDSFGGSLRFTYYPNGRLAKVNAARGVVMHYSYDRRGNLEHAVSSAGIVRRYHYEDAHHANHLTGVSVADAKPRSYGERNDFERLTTWAYDDKGRAISSSYAADAGRISLAYGDGYTDVADAFGRVSRYSWQRRDGIAVVTGVRGPGCSACGRGDVAYQFNSRFQITQVIAKHAPALRYRYDAQARLVEVDREAAGRWERVVRYEYAGGHAEPSVIERASINPDDVHSIEIEYRPDRLPQEVRERGYAPTSEGGYTAIERSVRFEYDGDGQLVSIDGPRSDVRDFVRFEYDSRGRVLAAVSADGLEQRVLERDRAGRPELVVVSGRPQVRVRYDAAGRVASITQARAAGERAWRYGYDAASRLTKIQLPDGRTQRIEYDAQQSAVRTSAPSGVTQATLLGADGRIAKRALLTRTGQILRMLHFAYDARRRLIEIRDGDGPALQQFVYDDDDDRPDRAIDPLGGQTLFGYGPRGRLTAITAADGGRMLFGYDGSGRITRLISPNNTRTRYEYDDFGRRVREHGADRGTIHYHYDPAGNLIGKTDARGERFRLTYTPGNTVRSIQTREGDTKLSYVNGRLSRVEGQWGAEAFVYDGDGNLAKHSRRVGDHEFTTEYRYGANGRVTRRRLVSGDWLMYEYDRNGSLQRVVHQRGLEKRTLLGQRDGAALNPVWRVRYGNGLMLRGRVSNRGRLAVRSTSGVNRVQYRYDEAGRLVGVDDAVGSRSYDYDPSHRLVAARSPNGVRSYTYDVNGNRKAVSSFVSALARRRNILRTSRSGSDKGAAAAPAVTASYRYAARSNRLISVDGARTATVLYDAAGNPTHVGNRMYEYNSLGRPIRLLIDGSLVAEYGYNIRGERISKTLYSHGRATTTYYIYEQHRLAAEVDQRGRVMREYLYLDQHPVVMLDRGAPHWIHTDHLGAPVAVTDENRIVVWRAEYQPFGLADVQEDPDGDGRSLILNLRFPGQYADQESGTYYNVLRDYDPALGRYLTPDPLGSFDGPNPFAYVRGNPLSRIDPLGLYLFAFDGTWVNRSSGTLTNVELFRQYYDPTVNEEHSFYRRGIGTPDPDDNEFATTIDRVLGGAFGLGGQRLIREALHRLDDLVADSVPGVSFDGTIDIVGFSRGAAIARAFANEVYERIDSGDYQQALESSPTCRSLRIRFMGLFDTVGAFGWPGNSIDIGYDFRIDDRIGAVAHAVALNEHRAAFDLLSIQFSEQSPNTTPYRDERGFIGAHSDIGGGYGVGDLSDIALRWMHGKALTAGVKLRPLGPDHLTVRSPIIHDERAFAQDREIFYPNDPSWMPAVCHEGPIDCLSWRPPLTQRQLTAPQFQFPELRSMIIENPQPSSVRGVVDMERYTSWLRSRGQL